MIIWANEAIFLHLEDLYNKANYLFEFDLSNKNIKLIYNKY